MPSGSGSCFAASAGSVVLGGVGFEASAGPTGVGLPAFSLPFGGVAAGEETCPANGDSGIGGMGGSSLGGVIGMGGSSAGAVVAGGTGGKPDGSGGGGMPSTP